MNKMKNYFAITIGPVYDTIKQSKSTRELWASSYIFSALMREILYASKGKLGDLLTPSIDYTNKTHRYGAGIYPDRAFWELSSSEDANQFSKIVSDAYKSLGKISNINQSIIEKYFRIYGVKIEREINSNNSIILELNKYLDNWELQDRIQNSTIKFVDELDENIQLLYEDGHSDTDRASNIFINYECGNTNYRRLPSIVEISTSDLKMVDQSKYNHIVTSPTNDTVCELIRLNRRDEKLKKELDNDDQIVTNLKAEFNEEFRFRHKYVAFIKADGDKMGATLGLIANDFEKVKKFSELLSDFNKQAAEIIVSYGGIPIYIGGDDLLFVAPLKTSSDNKQSSGDNIFELISKLDNIFPSKLLAELIDNKTTPSISYGISMSYYNFPMEETLDVSNSALYMAKAYTQSNALYFEVRKHSGQQFGGLIPKNNTKALLSFFSLISNSHHLKNDSFLTSVMHKITKMELLFTDAIQNTSLDWFFKHHFNEKEHSKFDEFIKNVKQLTSELMLEFNNENSVKDTVFACLRFVQFVNQPDHD